MQACVVDDLNTIDLTLQFRWHGDVQTDHLFPGIAIDTLTLGSAQNLENQFFDNSNETCRITTTLSLECTTQRSHTRHHHHGGVVPNESSQTSLQTWMRLDEIYLSGPARRFSTRHQHGADLVASPPPRHCGKGSAAQLDLDAQQ